MVQAAAVVLTLMAAVAEAREPVAPDRFDAGEAADDPAVTRVPAVVPQAHEPPRAQPSIGTIPPEILRVATDVRDRPLPDRITAISAALLGRPYLSDPLGEGQGHDADPFARYDVFDCLTFVEEVLALALAGDPAHAADVRDALRYGAGPRTYAHRHHFMELQWIPANLAAGWLVDTTRDYGETLHLEREVTPATWAAWGRRGLFAHTDDELPTGVMKLDVLPVDAAIAAHDRIRPGSILLTVREDRPWIPLWITHVGLVVSGDRPTMRHATKMGGGISRDHGLKWYLENLSGYGSWNALGVAILEPIEQLPRRPGARPRDD